MEEFSCRTRVVSGSGTIRVLGKLEKKRLFLVTDVADDHECAILPQYGINHLPHGYTPLNTKRSFRYGVIISSA